GVVAVITVTLASTVGTSSVPIAIGSTAGVLPNGTAATVSGTGGAIAVQSSGQVTLSSLGCSPSSLAPSTNATCTVTLTGAGPKGGSKVALSDNNSALSVPGSVTVSAGATSATFTASAGSVSGNQSVTITASLNGKSATTTVTISATVGVSALQCSP